MQGSLVVTNGRMRHDLAEDLRLFPSDFDIPKAPLNTKKTKFGRTWGSTSQTQCLLVDYMLPIPPITGTRNNH